MALHNPLIGELSVKTAKGMLVNITGFRWKIVLHLILFFLWSAQRIAIPYLEGGSDMTLWEVDRAAQKITEEVIDESANIIFGSAFDDTLNGKIRVSIVATGIEEITW